MNQTFYIVAYEGIAEFAGLEIAGLENDRRSRRGGKWLTGKWRTGKDGLANDGLQFGGRRNEGQKIFQFCKCQSPVTDSGVLHWIWMLIRAAFILCLLCVMSSSLVIVIPLQHIWLLLRFRVKTTVTFMHCGTDD